MRSVTRSVRWRQRGVMVSTLLSALVSVGGLSGCTVEPQAGAFFCLSDDECLAGWHCGGEAGAPSRCVEGPAPDADLRSDLGDAGLEDAGAEDMTLSPDEGAFVTCGAELCAPERCEEGPTGIAVCVQGGAPTIERFAAAYDPAAGALALELGVVDDAPMPDAFFEIVLSGPGAELFIPAEDLWPMDLYDRGGDNRSEGATLYQAEALIGQPFTVAELLVTDGDGHRRLAWAELSGAELAAVGEPCSPDDLARPCASLGWCRPVYEGGEITGGVCLDDTPGCLLPDGLITEIVPRLEGLPVEWTVDLDDGARTALGAGTCNGTPAQFAREAITRFIAPADGEYLFTLEAAATLGPNGDPDTRKVPVMYMRRGCHGELPADAPDGELACDVSEVEEGEDGGLIAEGELRVLLDEGEGVYLYVDGQGGWSGQASLAVYAVDRRPTLSLWYNPATWAVGVWYEAPARASAPRSMALLIRDVEVLPAAPDVALPMPFAQLDSERPAWAFLVGSLPFPLAPEDIPAELSVRITYEDDEVVELPVSATSGPFEQERGDLCDPFQGWSECEPGTLCGPSEDHESLADLHLCQPYTAACPALWGVETLGVEGVGPWQADGSTEEGHSRRVGECDRAWSPFAPDVTYGFQAPEDGTYLFRLTPDDGFDALIYWSEACGYSPRGQATPVEGEGRDQCLALSDWARPELPATIWAEMAAGETVYVTVDGAGMDDGFSAYEAGRFSLEIRQGSPPRLLSGEVRYNPEANSVALIVAGEDVDLDTGALRLRLIGDTGLPLDLGQGAGITSALIPAVIERGDGGLFQATATTLLPQALRPLIWDDAQQRLILDVEIRLEDVASLSSEPLSGAELSLAAPAVVGQGASCDVLQAETRCDVGLRCAPDLEICTPSVDRCPLEWSTTSVIPGAGVPIANGTRWTLQATLPGQRHDAPATCDDSRASAILNLSGLPDGRYEVQVTADDGSPVAVSARGSCRWPTRIYPQAEFDCVGDLGAGEIFAFVTPPDGGEVYLFVSGEPGEATVTITHRIPIPDE